MLFEPFEAAGRAHYSYPLGTEGKAVVGNVFMAEQQKAAFVDTVLKTVPEFPNYYRRMKRINSDGPPILNGVPGLKAIPPAKIQEEHPGAVIIDLRRPEAFGGAHIPGAFNIGAGQNLSMWAAWVVPYGDPIILTGDEETNIEEACRALVRVGFDDIRGYLKGGVKAWIEAGFDQAHVTQIGVRELSSQLDLSEAPCVLDVRSPAEWKAGHIARRGVVNVNGGMGAWSAQHLPLIREA